MGGQARPCEQQSAKLERFVALLAAWADELEHLETE